MKAMCIDENKNFVAHAILERGENRGKVVLTV